MRTENGLGKQIIRVGDFNCDWLQIDPDIYQLDQLIQEPTCITESTESY